MSENDPRRQTVAPGVVITAPRRPVASRAPAAPQATSTPTATPVASNQPDAPGRDSLRSAAMDREARADAARRAGQQVPLAANEADAPFRDALASAAMDREARADAARRAGQQVPLLDAPANQMYLEDAGLARLLPEAHPPGPIAPGLPFGITPNPSGTPRDNPGSFGPIEYGIGQRPGPHWAVGSQPLVRGLRVEEHLGWQGNLDLSREIVLTPTPMLGDPPLALNPRLGFADDGGGVGGRAEGAIAWGQFPPILRFRPQDAPLADNPPPPPPFPGSGEKVGQSGEGQKIEIDGGKEGEPVQGGFDVGGSTSKQPAEVTPPEGTQSSPRGSSRVTVVKIPQPVPFGTGFAWFVVIIIRPSCKPSRYINVVKSLEWFVQPGKQPIGELPFTMPCIDILGAKPGSEEWKPASNSNGNSAFMDPTGFPLSAEQAAWLKANPASSIEYHIKCRTYVQCFDEKSRTWVWATYHDWEVNIAVAFVAPNFVMSPAPGEGAVGKATGGGPIAGPDDLLRTARKNADDYLAGKGQPPLTKLGD